MRGLKALMGWGLTITLSYYWTRAVIAVEQLQGDQSSSSLGLMVLLAVGPLTLFFTVSHAFTLLPSSGRFLSAYLALVQTCGTLWGWVVVKGTSEGAGAQFLLAGAIAGGVTVVLFTLFTLRHGKKSLPIDSTRSACVE